MAQMFIARVYDYFTTYLYQELITYIIQIYWNTTFPSLGPGKYRFT